MLKRACSIFCAVFMVLSVLILPVSASGKGSAEGVTFAANHTYTMANTLSTAPLTFEAVVKLPENYTSRAGVIVGNYVNSTTQCVSFEISNNGVPRFYAHTGASLAKTDIKFENVNIATGEYVHLALVLDTASGNALCYVDGQLKQTISGKLTGFTVEALKSALMVGGDKRSDNAQYFKGHIKSVAVYSNVRGASQIASDISAFDKNDTALLVAYDLVGAENSNVSDLSANNIKLINSADRSEIYAKGGMTFTADELYRTEKEFAAAPLTYEAWVYVPKTMSDRAGAVIGNYGRSSASLSFEIYSGGVPRLFSTDAEGNTTHNISFTGADVRTGDWAHVAITYDVANATAKCYIDGVLKSEVNDAAKIVAFDSAAYTQPMALGGDFRGGNAQYFKGAIKSAAIFSGVRTAEQILADKTAINNADSTLMAYYAVTDASMGKKVEDGSSNDFDLKYSQVWFTDKAPVTDYAYSFCVVGDTQKVTYYDPENLHCIYDWIVANKESKNIQYVFGLGDITEKSTTEEWALAKSQIYKLNGVVPYSLVRGNHDKTDGMNDTFGELTYAMNFDEFYETGKVDNVAAAFTVGETKYLSLVLDYGASDAVLAWASGVVEKYSDHKVIVTTHAYLFRDGTTLDENDVVPPSKDLNNVADATNVNNGDHMWNEFLSKHENIFLVMSGHDPSDKVVVTQTEGEKGNTVTQILVDPQGVDDRLRNAGDDCTGMITMLYFSEDGSTITVETYSTIREQYYMTDNQMVINVAQQNTVGGGNTNDGSADTNPPDKAPETNAPETDTDTETEPPVDDGDKGAIGWIIGISIAVVGIAVATAVVIPMLTKKKK